MNVEVLDIRDLDENKKWFLCTGNLSDYLTELKDDFYEYSIQRKIVKNQYLDKLINTIDKDEPLSPITLTLQDDVTGIEKGGSFEVKVSEIEILDGLQRTFRLWAHKYVAEEYLKQDKPESRPFARELKTLKPALFDSGVISLKTINSLVKEGLIDKIEAMFSSYKLYFAIWSNLSDDEIIKKMLILNAGQKSVTKTHQYELLYLHYYDAIEAANTGVTLYREKDKEASSIKAGKRDDGEFMFTSIIMSLVSFAEGNPRRVSLEDLNIVNDDKETPNELYTQLFSLEFLENYLKKLLYLDREIHKNDIEGLKRKWFSKDTFINGVYGGLGKYLNIPNLRDEDLEAKTLKDRLNEGMDKLISQAETGLDFDGFVSEYKKVNSISVNIGSHLRKIIASYVNELLEQGATNWEVHFNKFRKN